MGRTGKWVLGVVVGSAILLAIGITATIGWRPFIGAKARPLTARKFEATPQRLERGRYVATALSGCIYCHSPHDWNAAETPMIAGKEGTGEVEPYMGLPGRIVASNITPDPETGAGTWSDDQLARAIREGIGHDGRALFPLMPYERFKEMSDEDVASVIVYLRSLPAVRSELPKTEIIFPVKYLVRNAPRPLSAPVAEAAFPDPVKRGEHLVQLAGCLDCHTPSDKGSPLPGMKGAGGEGFEGPWGFLASANITQDESGIPYYDEALFFDAMRTGSVKARKLSPIMPVMVYKNLSDEDLKAMFAYVRTLKPVKHSVDNSETPTACRLCRLKHGGGERN
jgi:mono/diheme cytochrome c family protein